MTKLTKKNLPRGTALGPTQVYDNLNTVVGAINGLAGAAYLDNDNRQHSRGRFIMSWNLGTVIGKVTKSFNIPLLQEFFLPSLEPTPKTPSIKLESLCLYWDRGGQQNARIIRSAVATNPLINYKYRLNETPDHDAYVRIYQGAENNSVVVGEVGLSKSEYGLLADESDFIELLPKQALLNVTIDPYKVYKLEFQSLFNSNPTYNVVIKAEFSHPLVERDNAALKNADVTPLVPRNAPLHSNARVVSAHSLTTPVEGDSIQASGVKGVQTQIEVIDGIVTKGLSCGLDRFSRIRRAESILEDQNYFVMTVPLFNYEEAIGTANILQYTNGIGGVGTTNTQIWDRAVIPIVYPMTVHHVQLSFAVDELTVGTWPIANRNLAVGVAAGHVITPWSERLYTQIARTPAAANLTTNKIAGSSELFSVPLSYPATPDGGGWVAQGRPVFAGRELGNQNQTGVLQRSLAADRNNAAALVPPPANGAEQAIEVRAMLSHSAGTALNDSGLGTYTAFPRGGVFVHIYGKVALTE